MVFDRSGIGLQDLAWIQRDQFVYYVEMTHALSDPRDWPRFRQDLLGALTAAFGLDAHRTDSNAPPAPRTTTSHQYRALALLDRICARHDPAADWSAFLEVLWEARRDVRADL